MSKKTLRTGDLENDSSTRPAILRRKRKSTSDLELCSTSSACNSGIAPESSAPKIACIGQSQPVQNMNETCNQSTSPTTFSQFRALIHLTPSTSNCDRESPLPQIKWANSQDVWGLLVQKDLCYPRNHDMFSRHPELQAKMRAILLDWLSEVCEVYKLHRETFYLAQDYVDRYLGQKVNMPKSQMQLLGITALFIAAKMEEIYPPKLKDFAYVTDGACTEAEILEQEIVILQALNWDLTPVTIHSWLCIYLQLACNFKNDKAVFLQPQFSSHEFAQIAQLLDLCILDVGCLQFSYSVVAASAISHMLGKQLAYKVSGLKLMDVMPCYNWMVPFVQAVMENGVAQLKFFNRSSEIEVRNIQIHNTDLKLLEKAHNISNNLPLSERSLEDNCSNGVLTPPQSCKKISAPKS